MRVPGLALQAILQLSNASRPMGLRYGKTYFSISSYIGGWDSTKFRFGGDSSDSQK
nr:MAG TPA: hypothetical protein [Caudoviricetes sp.]